MIDITLEWKTKADAQLALAILSASRVKPVIIDVKDEEDRDVPLQTEERW